MATASSTAKSSTSNRVGLPKQSKYRYRLVDLRNARYKSDILMNQSRCNLEILKEGIMVIGEFPDEDSIIPLIKDEIESITLERGKEVIDTFYLSPMHILSKFGVPNRISRYFSFFPWEYKIAETRITIRCQDRQLKLITSGHRYEKLVRNLKNLGYSEELDIVKKPILNVLNYTS